MEGEKLTELLARVGTVEAEGILASGAKYEIKLDNTGANPEDDTNAIAEGESSDTAKGVTKTYEVLVKGEIGEGGFGTVYKVTVFEEKTAREACLKQARYSDFETIIKENDIFNKFEKPLNDYIIARRFACQRIATGEYYLGLEYFDGDTLSAIITRYKESKDKVVPNDLVHILKQQTEAIAYLQSSKIYHGDITPNNIMYHPGLQKSKLIDFGLAVCYDNQGDVKPCNGGTTEYKAPEMLIQSEIGDRSDLYGLAATLLHLIARRPPWHTAQVVGINWEERGVLETCIKAEIKKYHHDSDMAAGYRSQPPEMTVQNELRRYGQFYNPSIIDLLCEMLHFETERRPRCLEVIERIPSPHEEPSTFRQNAGGLLLDESDANEGDGYNAAIYQPVSSITYSEGVWGTAVEKFAASTNSELSFEVGQRVLNVVTLTGGYSRGRIGNQCGTFPTNFVRLNGADEIVE